MAESTAPRTPRCFNCDGFPVVAVTTGRRHRDGSRETASAACPACRGTGSVAVLARVLVGGRV
ncbi:MAG TPA: hypothetical protein DEQ61_24555 [Streptomyces sp.]|nr:hypothetical protein [Streptomyces sp.]